jgi:hypothetical protein
LSDKRFKYEEAFQRSGIYCIIENYPIQGLKPINLDIVIDVVDTRTGSKSGSWVPSPRAIGSTKILYTGPNRVRNELQFPSRGNPGLIVVADVTRKTMQRSNFWWVAVFRVAEFADVTTFLQGTVYEAIEQANLLSEASFASPNASTDENPVQHLHAVS